MPTIDMDATKSAAVGAEYLDVDPATLVLDQNIRTDADIDEQFAADIAEHGVETALTVRRDLVGQLLIIDGQRRYLAAIKAGLPTVPVKVVDGVGDDEERIARQYRLNEQRKALTTSEKVAAVEQLALFGRTPKAIARRLGRPEAEVTAALAVAQSKSAKAAITEPEIDLAAAAVIAEFDDDPEAVTELQEVAVTRGRGALEHAAETKRQERARAAAVAALKAQLTAAGVKVLDQPGWALKGNKHEPLGDLAATPWKGSGPYPKALTADEHTTCPEHAVYVREAYGREADDGLAIALPFCLDWKANGHHRRTRAQHQTAGAADEDATAERRHVVAQNKKSDAAREVRMRWLRELLAVPKLLPKDAAQHAAAVIAANRSAVGDWGVSQALDDLLGDSSSKARADKARRTPASATWYLLALAFAIGEAATPRDFWRKPAYHAAMPRGDVIAGHLQQLAAWGYTLSEIEQAYVDEHAAPTADGGED